LSTCLAGEVDVGWVSLKNMALDKQKVSGKDLAIPPCLRGVIRSLEEVFVEGRKKDFDPKRGGKTETCWETSWKEGDGRERRKRLAET